MKTIPLTQGLIVKVDDEDYDKLVAFKWHTKRLPKPYAYHENFSMARMIMNAQVGQVVDHINGDTLDNRKDNLRVCQQGDNLKNRAKQKNHTGNYKGVYLLRGKYWNSKIYVDKKTIQLGYFNTEREAAIAYNEASLKYHGEYGYINEIRD